MHYIEKGTAEFRKVTIGFFIGGLVTFAVMYCTQPLLPLYSKEFHSSPATTSLVISITTAFLAVMMTFAAALSNAWGRKNIMTCSLFGASVLTVISAFSPSFAVLLICRALEGIVLAGLPAIAMAYLGEEVEPRHLGSAMGVYIGGNAIGGMMGRVATGIITDLASWRVAVLCIGLAGLLCAWWFWGNLPASRHFVVQPFSLRKHARSLFQQLKDPGQLCLYGIAFLLMGSFVSLYSYLGYQLVESPYNLSQAVIGWIFVIYIFGSLGSSLLARLADRWSRQRAILLSIVLTALGALIALDAQLPIKLLGVIVLTFGFFGAHAIASGWVGVRAGRSKAQASALYLFFYYVGSSVGNTAGGFFWSAYNWPGVIGMVAVFALGALGLAFALKFSARPQVSSREYQSGSATSLSGTRNEVSADSAHSA
ncbi:MFS transporter [Ktedonosporobacter rubrisoli]|uniref:MFS transporter n=1 Tax=Ktedonosporobacter rubrisoli TaxID=2509675 RepID=A0A4P6JTH4_KTERU|nr:MFS transporter [Ktedonosporobacter rubrisoli]QBD78613.1 MFS transporter [Ktedonosporobacter rubrisoli]